MILLLIILSISFIVVVGCLIKATARRKDIEHMVSLLKAERDDLASKSGYRAEEIRKLDNQIQTLKVQIDQLNSDNKELSVQLKAQDVKDEVSDTLKAHLMELQDQINERQHLLDEAEQRRVMMMNEQRLLESKLTSLKESILATQQWRDGRDDDGYDLMDLFDDDDFRLVRLIEQVVYEVPELKKDLMNVLWKRVWIGKMQTMSKTLGIWGTPVCGIYRLCRKDDDLCYIGQAVDIKERWYQHAKKMLGVDNKGGELLYKRGGPGDFIWEIVEVWDDGYGDDRKEWLNERERFWIEICGDLNRS